MVWLGSQTNPKRGEAPRWGALCLPRITALLALASRLAKAMLG